MTPTQEAYELLKRAVNIKYYIGSNRAQLIEDACTCLTEAEKRPPSYVAPKEPEVLPTEAEVDEALFED